MNPLFPDKLWNYKNFNMVTELDIAGEFIYDGMHTFNQLEVMDQDSMLFSFLYHISVGLERLQKIILVLFEKFNMHNHVEFEKSLITHSHVELNRRICKSTELKLNSRENDFLQLLATFYKSARYHRFNFESQYSNEQQMIADFIVKYIPANKIQYHFITNKILITSDVKEFMGKVIGAISKRYYKLVRNGCARNNTYTYELRSGSKAEKIFLSNHRNNSLQQQKITEMIVFKELIVYLINTKDTSSFLRFIKEIQPLDLDIGLLNEYLSELSQGNISQSLIDEVEYQYEEKLYSIERMEMVNLIGDTNVIFEFKDIKECFDMIEGLMNDDYDYKDFALHFPKQLALVENESPPEVLDEISELCSNYLSKNMSDAKFFQEVKNHHISFEECYNFESE